MALRRYFGKISFLEIGNLVGHNGELVIDEATDYVYVMDGITAGGQRILYTNVNAAVGNVYANVNPSITNYFTLGNVSNVWAGAYIKDANFSGNISIDTWINPTATTNSWGNLRVNASKLNANLIYAQTNITTDGTLSANVISANSFVEVNTANFSGYLFGGLGTNSTGLKHANVGNVSTIYLSSNGNSSFTSYANSFNAVDGYTQFYQNVYITGNNVTIPNYTTIGLLPSFNPANARFTYVDSVNSYSQVLIQNKSSGTSASGDIVVTADNGTDSTKYIDLGINSSTFSGGGGLDAANDGYLLVEGGKLVVATLTANKDIVFAIGGDSAANEIGRFKSSNGLVVTGNATVSGNVNITGNLNVTGNIVTTNYEVVSKTEYANSIIASGNISATFYTGNGYYLTGVQTSYSNTNVAAYLANSITTDINITGNISPTANAVYSLGTLTNQWKSLYVSNNTIYIGGTAVQVANGSLLVGGNTVTGGTTYSNANVAAYLPTDSTITTLNSNAATQANLITTINANVTAANSAITTLTSNAATQANLITTINANVTAANSAIANINANVTAANSAISTINANITSANSAISTINANVTAANSAITTLTSNAATQANLITTVNSNVTAANSAITTINANVTAANSAIATLSSNAASQASDIVILYSNAGVQANSITALNNSVVNLAGEIAQIQAGTGFATTQQIQAANSSISTLNANLNAANLNISTLQSNTGTIASNVNILFTNAASQASDITTLYSNAATQASNLATLTTNAASQASDITTLYSNAATQANLIALLNSNVSGANSAIVTANSAVTAYANSLNNAMTANINAANANLGSLTGRVTVVEGNIVSINNTLIGVINGAFSYGNANVATYLPQYTGNLTAGNITVNGNLFVTGNITTLNYETINNTEYANSIIASGNITASGNVGASFYTGNGYYLTGLASTYGNTQVSAYYVANTVATSNVQILRNGNIRLPTGATINESSGNGYLTLNPNTSADALAGVVIGGSGYLLSSNGTRNAVLNYNSTNGQFGVYILNVYGNQQNAIVNGGSANNYGNIGGITSFFGNAFVSNIYSPNYLYPNGTSILAGVSGTYGNTQVGYYLNSNLISSTISVTGNVIANAHYGNSYLYSNGVSILTGISGTYGNTQVAAYLPTYTGNLTAGNITVTGNITHPSNSYILGDFTNSTVAYRTMFQTANVNSSTGIYALPSGSSTAASWQAANSTNPTNASKILIATNGSTDVQLVSGINGTGTYLPLSFYNNGAAQMVLYPNGNIYMSNANPITTTGNINVGNINVTANVNAANINVTNNLTYGNVSTTGNITAGYLITTGSGGNITGASYVVASNFVITNYGNISGANVITANTFTGTSATISGNLYSSSVTGKSSAIVAQNTAVIMDNIKVQWLNNGSSNANQLQLGSLSGTPQALYTYIFQSGLGGGTTGGSSNTALSTTYANIGSPSGTAGDMFMFTATVGTNAYRVSAITGSGYSNNLISIERLV